MASALAGGVYLYLQPDKLELSQGAGDAPGGRQPKGEKAEEAGGGGEAGEDHKDVSRISEAAAESLGLEVLEAGGATVRETISVSGRVTLNQNTTAQVKARFPGIVKSVTKQPGESVQAGETLATVESNDSLQVYPVAAPVSGTVISRNANTGELAGTEPLYVIADLKVLWAELFVFSKDGEHLKPGQKVRILCLDDPISTESTISLVLPTTEASSQTVVARSVIQNPDNHWRSGMNVRADVVLAEKTVPLAVKTEAIQRMEGKAVVFVKNADGSYQARPVDVGSGDAEWTEIKSGLSVGERYVAKNSFVVKADIGKAGAADEE
ncbi:MAG: hypothetical protein BGO49_10825 [Planctomycetales bacterium 71-10]|nr:MAG: hypothetical protein BGO49_10825 [Planctomycetales bacterium 71-10]